MRDTQSAPLSKGDPPANSTTATTAHGRIDAASDIREKCSGIMRQWQGLSATTHGVMAIPPTIAIGTTMLAIGFCLTAIADIVLSHLRIERAFGWHGELAELSTEDFENILIYPCGELVFSLRLGFHKRGANLSACSPKKMIGPGAPCRQSGRWKRPESIQLGWLRAPQ